MKKVFICSPFRGDFEGNINYAKRMCRLAISKGYAPIAPHLLYPQFLEEDSPTDRKLGIEAGLEFLLTCDEMWVCLRDKEPSEGMRMEIEFAKQNNKKIVYFSPWRDA